MGREDVEARSPFPKRAPVLDLTARLLVDFHALVGEWATWAAGGVEQYLDDLRAAKADDVVT